MVAPSFLGSGTLVDATSGTTIGPVPLPAGASSGDFAILSVISHGSTTLSTPTGWTAFTGGVQANANLSSAFFWRRLDGTTGDNVPTVSSSASFSTINSAGARIRTYSGVITSGTPFDAVTGSGPTENDTPTSGAVTTTDVDRLIVSMVGMANDAVVVDGDWSTLPAAGWALDGAVDNWNYDGDGTLLSVSKTQATAATVAAADVGTYISTVTFWRSFTIALIPEPTTASIVDFGQVANWFTDNDGASIAVDYVADDILVYFATIENGNSAGTQDVGPPTGANITFTEGPHGGAGDSNASATGIWYGQATGPGSSVTHNATVATPSIGYNGAAVLVIRGGTLTGLQEFGDTPSASSPYSITTPAGAVVVVGFGEWNATSGFTGTTGSGTHTERVDTDDGSHYGIWLGTWEGTDAATDDFGITNYSGTTARQVGLVIPAQGPPSSAPTDPTSVVATSADSEATVTWVDGSGSPEPTWDVGYRVDAGSWTTSASDLAQGVQTRTQTGLTNGTTVRFRVRGQNTAGDSAWVESNDVTVGSIPLEILDPTSSGNNTAGNPQNVAYPAHSVGDLIVQSIAIDANVTATVPTTGPNGETITAITTNVNPGAAGPRFSAWWWIATGAETAGNISVTLSAAEQTSSEAFRVPAGSFDPADPIPDISANGTQTSGTGTTITMPSFTATVEGGLVVAMGGVDADPMDATFSPAGWSDVITHDVGAVSSFVAQRTALTTASESISAAAFGINTGDTASVVGFVIAPAPAEAGPVEGTATLAYGYTAAVVGTTVVLGSIAPSFGGSVAVTGQTTRLGSVSLAYGGSVAVTGTIPTSDITGTVALAYGGSVAVSGLVLRSGSAAIDYGGSDAATGLVYRRGSASLSYGYSLAAVGTGSFPTAIQAVGETDLWAGASGDIADDPWIWRNPAAPASSFILGVSKSAGSDGGVYTFDLDGTEVNHWLAVTINGVDGRDLSLYPGVDVDWDGRVLVLATDRTNDQLRFGFLATNGTITSAGSTSLAFEPYGCCLYVSPVDGAVYAFVSEATGGSDALRQHELTITGDTVTSTQVRSLDTASLSEGMACYDSGELFFLGEEDAGLYAYDAEPDGGTSRTAVDTVAGELTADVEGVTVIEPYGDQPGYLIVSSQGASDFQIYNLASPHDYVATFEITAGTVESVDDCDGIHGHRGYFGPSFPDGILVTHDATNGTASNYKISDLGDLFGPLPTLVVEGTASLVYGGSVAVSGTTVSLGTTSPSYGGAVAAVGSVRRSGSAVLSYGGSLAATGEAVRLGDGSQSYGGSVSASGQTTRIGSAALDYGYEVAASGVIPTGAVLGTAAVSYGGAVAVTGLVRRSGVAVVDLGGSVVVSGTVVSEGDGSASYGGAVTVDGAAIRLGTAVLDYAGSVAATGTIPTDQGEGTAALVYGGTVVAVGQVSRLGVGTIDLGGSVTTSGTVRRLGVATVAYGGSVVVVVDTALDLVDVAHSAVLADWLAHRAVLEESLGHRASLGFTKEDFMKLRASTSERVPVVVHTTADPTGTLPTFSITADDSGFQSGAWDSDGWDSTTGRIVAWSPLIGSGATLDVAGGSEYDLYIGWTVPGEDPVKETGVLVVE